MTNRFVSFNVDYTSIKLIWLKAAWLIMIRVAAPEFLILNTVAVYEIALSMTKFSSLNQEIFHQNLKLKLSHWALILIVHCLNSQLLYKPIPLSTAAKLHQFGGPQSCQK